MSTERTISFDSCMILEDRLKAILDININISSSLVELADEQVVVGTLHTRGLTGCEVSWMPHFCQYGIDGSTLSFSSLLATRKCSRLEPHQIQMVESLLQGSYTDQIACTTFYYPTGAVMGVTFDPHKLANLLLAYELSSKKGETDV